MTYHIEYVQLGHGGTEIWRYFLERKKRNMVGLSQKRCHQSPMRRAVSLFQRECRDISCAGSAATLTEIDWSPSNWLAFWVVAVSPEIGLLGITWWPYPTWSSRFLRWLHRWPKETAARLMGFVAASTPTTEHSVSSAKKKRGGGRRGTEFVGTLDPHFASLQARFAYIEVILSACKIL